MSNENLDAFILEQIGKGVNTARAIVLTLPEGAVPPDREALRVVDKSLQRLRKKKKIKFYVTCWHLL